MTGTLLLTGYLGGAILATLVGHASVVAPVAVGLAVWLGAWLRIPEFRALVPVRR